jgi:hypothetical protein
VDFVENPVLVPQRILIYSFTVVVQCGHLIIEF